MFNFTLWSSKSETTVHTWPRSYSRKKIEKNLGVALSIDVKFTSHVTFAVTKAGSATAAQKWFIMSQDKNVYIELYKTSLRPHVEYAITIWNPYLKRGIQLREKFWKRAIKCIYGLQHFPYDQRLALEIRRRIADLTE